MTKVDTLNRALSWLRVSPDALVTATLTARNERDWIDISKLGTWLGGGKLAVRFRVRNALELALSPEASIDLGVYHPGGIPVGSGTFFPPPPSRRPAGTEDLVRAAFSLPFLEGAFGVQIDWDDEHFLAGDRRIDAAELAAAINTRLGQLGDPPPPDIPEEERPPPAPTKLKDPSDPIVLISPNAAVIAPGHTVSPAQALADALGRPVLAPGSSYLITRDGAVLAVRRPSPDATVFGRDWRPGNWVAVFPRAQGRDPHPLPQRNLADAIRAARHDLGWTLQVGDRPGLVPPPSRDVPYPAETPQRAIDKWREDVAATQQLAAVARELLRERDAGERGAELAAELGRADAAARAVPAPPATLPATAEDRAAVWQNRTRFQDAASDLGRVVADVLAAVFTRWQQLIDPYLVTPERVRELLPHNGEPEPALAAALARLDAAVREISKPPAGFPATAAQASDVMPATGKTEAELHDFDRALSDVFTLAFRQWDAQAAGAETRARARAAATLLPYTGEGQADLREKLDKLIAAQPALPALPLDSSMPAESVRDAWQAHRWVADVEGAIRDVLTAATDLKGLQSRLAAASHLYRAAGEMLPYTSERQAHLRARRDGAYAELKGPKPSWWLEGRPKVSPAEDIEKARQWLAGNEPARLRREVRRFERVITEVVPAANQTSERLERLVRSANELLQHTGAQQRRALGPVVHPPAPSSPPRAGPSCGPAGAAGRLRRQRRQWRRSRSPQPNMPRSCRRPSAWKASSIACLAPRSPSGRPGWRLPRACWAGWTRCRKQSRTSM